MIKDFNRRQMLIVLLGIPTMYMKLDSDTEHAQIEYTALLFNDDPMLFIEDTVRVRWNTQLMGGPQSAAHGLGRLEKEVEAFAEKVQRTGWRYRAYAQLCMVYQLRGSVAGDLMHYDQSLAWYRRAYQLAQELNDVELMAAVRVRQGITLTRKESAQEDIEYFTHALDLITGRGFPILRGNALAVLSEAYAKVWRAQDSWRSIGLAERVLEQSIQERERSHRVFNASVVTTHKGISALLLKDYDRALILLDKGLKAYKPTHVPGRARLLARKSEAYYGQGEIDYCVDAAKEAFSIAISVDAKNTITRVKQLHTSLVTNGWERERGTLELGIMLTNYERTCREANSGT